MFLLGGFKFSKEKSEGVYIRHALALPPVAPHRHIETKGGTHHRPRHTITEQLLNYLYNCMILKGLHALLNVMPIYSGELYLYRWRLVIVCYLGVVCVCCAYCFRYEPIAFVRLTLSFTSVKHILNSCCT